MIRYWSWLLIGIDGKRGIARFINRWLLVHLAIGIFLSFILPAGLREAANTVIMPMAAIFIGLSFAWGGNAQALLQTEEIENLTKHHPGGFVEYVYVYQTAILLILLTLICWSLAGFGVFDKVFPTKQCTVLYVTIGSVLFSLASLTIRECWQVVIGTQIMLLTRNKIKRESEKERNT